MFFTNHNFTGHDFETKHMSRIEKTIYLDLRSLYLSAEKPIDGSDMALLERRLSVIDEAEKQALAFVLKDKFNKAGKLFKRPAWDKIIKDYKFQQISIAVGDMTKRLRASGETIEANAGMSAIRELYIKRFNHDKLTRITNNTNAMTNAANDKENRANVKANPITNDDEYKLTSNDERKFMVDSLKGAGESVTLKTSIATLRELYTKHFKSDSKADATNAIHNANDMTNTNANAMTNTANDKANPANAENHAITDNHKLETNNHKPVRESDAHPNTGEAIIADDDCVDNNSDASQPTVTQPVVTKAEQIRSQNADDIENWEAPTIDTMRAELFRAGKMMQLTDDQYALHLEDFIAYYSEQARLGKSLGSDSLRKSKLRKWLISEVDKQATSQARQEKAKGTFNIDNEDWIANTANKPARSHDSDVPDAYHPSHAKPASQAKRDPKTSVMVNGLWKEPLPYMSVTETYEHISQQHMPGEMQDETYDRLLNQMQESA